jgi:uncharacterized protein YndB with AHSA1/START domain
VAAKENEAIAPFVISRDVAAPRDLVWKAWTEADRLAKWWGPKGMTVRVSKMDLRPGGTYHFALRGPDGRDMWGKWVFREIVPPGKLVWVHSFSDEQGGVTTHSMSPTWPRETLSTLTLTERQGKTTVQIHWVPIHPSDVERQTFEEAAAA